MLLFFSFFFFSTSTDTYAGKFFTTWLDFEPITLFLGTCILWFICLTDFLICSFNLALFFYIFLNFGFPSCFWFKDFSFFFFLKSNLSSFLRVFIIPLFPEAHSAVITDKMNYKDLSAYSVPSGEISDIYIQMKSLPYSAATLSTTDSPILMSSVFGNRFHHFTSCQVSYASTYQQTSFSLLYASNNCLQCQSLYPESLTTWYCYYYNYCYCMSFLNADGNSEEGIFWKEWYWHFH